MPAKKKPRGTSDRAVAQLLDVYRLARVNRTAPFPDAVFVYRDEVGRLVVADSPEASGRNQLVARYALRDVNRLLVTFTFEKVGRGSSTGR